MKALKKLTKPEKRRGALLREEIAWLEKTLANNPERIADGVRLVFEHPPSEGQNSYGKVTVVRIEGGRLEELQNKLRDMKRELGSIYDQGRGEEENIVHQDAKEVLAKLKPQLATQIEQYKQGETKVLGFLIGQ